MPYKPVGADENGKFPPRVEAALKSTYGTSIYPVSKGATGDGVANDYAALTAAVTAASSGFVIDLGGKTYNLGSMLTINKTVTIRNGTLLSSVGRVAIVTAPNVVLENVAFIRTGTAGVANPGALVLNAAGARLVDVTASSTVGEGLRMGNGNCNGTKIIRGSYSSSEVSDGMGIHLVSGGLHNYDIKISGPTVRVTGYGTGIALYNCSRSTVEHSDVRGIRRSPWVTLTGWTLVSGTVYRALDRTDVVSNAVYVNDVEYRKNTDPASTTPALNYYTTPGDGYLYINTGVSPATQAVKTTRTNGYGILMYATSSENLGMSDNLMAHNYVEDTDGFGLYYQTLENISKNNRTLKNTLRNVCLTGVTVGDLPFAGIGVFGGLDVQLDGDEINGVGSTLTPAPGVDLKASVGVPHMTGSLSNVSVLNAKGHGISLAPGTWRLTGVSTTYNTGSGITHGTVVTGDILDVTLTACVSTNNAGNGAYFETTSSGEIRPRFIGGRYTDNTIRNIALARCRDIFIGGGLISHAGGNRGINLTGTNIRAMLDGIFLRSGQGINIDAGIADLTVNNIVHDGSSGTKLTVAGPYKTGGSTGYGTQWRCAGSPEGVITAAIGSTCTRVDGGAGTTLYVKESGTGNTGWVAK